MTDRTLTIQVFGQLTELVGATRLTAPLFDDTAQLKVWLSKEYPSLNTATYVIAVDKKITREAISLHNHAAVALLPPFSGG